MRRTFQLKEKIELAPLTTLGVGGQALLVRAEREEQVADAVHFAYANSLDLFVLGGRQ